MFVWSAAGPSVMSNNRPALPCHHIFWIRHFSCSASTYLTAIAFLASIFNPALSLILMCLYSDKPSNSFFLLWAEDPPITLTKISCKILLKNLQKMCYRILQHFLDVANKQLIIPNNFVTGWALAPLVPWLFTYHMFLLYFLILFLLWFALPIFKTEKKSYTFYSLIPKCVNYENRSHL